MVMPAQFANMDWMMFCVLSAMKPMSAFVVLALESDANLPSCASTLRSCCCASAASSAERVKRSSRSSVLLTQVSRQETRCDTSLLAWITDSLRICSLTMLWSSSSSITSAISSPSPLSTAILTRVAVFSSILSWSAKLSKFSRMPHGIFCTSSWIIASSCIMDIRLMSCSVNGKPFRANNSSALTTTFSLFQCFATVVRMSR
mmetsp:Transcript_1588/g.4532  ORF Transcript_1588/g.4532 Transcript_1588/m.4532 type:complete len:203 (+) Transcript_1588:1129-1737(+)